MDIKESKRLENLRSYDILDTPNDPSFDKLARLASSICGTPMALITLMDESRVWLKSASGFSGGTEAPRNISFCSYTIQKNSITEVKDTLKDERFVSNPFVTNEPHIRFYAGAPLTSPEGYNLGALCVMDREPHELSDSQLEALKILAEQVVELLELRKTNKELAGAKRTLEEQQQLLINKARLQSIGELAGGVCHQINNPLAIIVGRSMILRSQINQRFPDEQEMLKELDVIDQTSQRVSNILKALRMYSKDLGDEITEISFHELLDDAITLMRGRITKEEVELTYTKGSDVKLRLNKNQISQAVIDVLSNSLEAMEESEIKNLEIHFSSDEENVYLTITDSGKGIRQEDADKIFDPFFSTKPRHFGVGLSNAKNFVGQHRGEIAIIKSKGPTTFQITFPKIS
jgi:two-component system NtrC family sensor kinase